MNYARLMTLPFALIVGYIAFQVFYHEQSEMSVYLIPFVVVIAAILVMTERINWHFYNKYPQRLDKKLATFFARFNKYYQNLSDADRIRFEQRLWLSMKHKEFIGMKIDNVPIDLQAVSLAASIEMTFNLDDFLFDNYNRVVLYQHPFPSPRYEAWHSCEHHKEDGVFIFSVAQMMPSFSQRDKYYDICLHEFALVFVEEDPLDNWFKENISWEDLDEMSTYDKKHIDSWVGLIQQNTEAVIIHHFFRWNENFKRLQPEAYTRLASLLNYPVGN